MSYFDSLSPEEFIALANLVAFTVVEGKSSKDNIILGSFLSTVASIMLSFAAQQNLVSSLKQGTESQVEDIPISVNVPVDILNNR